MLYGWKQVIHGKGKKYIYERRGILNRIPHLRIDQSSFIIPKRYFEEITNFLREWEDKVIWKHFEVLINEEIKRIFEELEGLHEGS